MMNSHRKLNSRPPSANSREMDAGNSEIRFAYGSLTQNLDSQTSLTSDDINIDHLQRCVSNIL